MNATDLARLEALLPEITPGSWTVAQRGPHLVIRWPQGRRGSVATVYCDLDAEAIALLRNLGPELVRAAKENVELRRTIEQMADRICVQHELLTKRAEKP